MKRNITLFTIILAIIGFMWCSTPARAADELISFKPASVTELKDKNGQPYVRMLWTQNADMNGVAYSKTVSVNAYGDHVAQARTLKPGQEVKAVASKKSYQGNTYYTILGFDKPGAAVKK